MDGTRSLALAVLRSPTSALPPLPSVQTEPARRPCAALFGGLAAGVTLSRAPPPGRARVGIQAVIVTSLHDCQI